LFIKPDRSENPFCRGVMLSLSKDFIAKFFDKLSMTVINGSTNKKIETNSRATATDEKPYRSFHNKTLKFRNKRPFLLSYHRN